MNAVHVEDHTLTGAYVCDALGDEERAAVERHLEECPVCAAEVAELREVTAIMAIAAAQAPPAGLKASVDALIGVTRQLPPLVGAGSEERPEARPEGAAVEAPETGAATAHPAPHRQGRWVRAGWAIAASVAIVAAGLGVRTIAQQHRIDALNAQSSQVTQLLAAPDAYSSQVTVNGGGTALVVDSRQRNEAAVVFSDLSQLPTGETYQLWLMAPNGTARSVGLMTTTPGAPVVVHGLTGASEVGMTVEPSGGSAEPTTTPVMVAALGT